MSHHDPLLTDKIAVAGAFTVAAVAVAICGMVLSVAGGSRKDW